MIAMEESIHVRAGGDPINKGVENHRRRLRVNLGACILSRFMSVGILGALICDNYSQHNAVNTKEITNETRGSIRS